MSQQSNAWHLSNPHSQEVNESVLAKASNTDYQGEMSVRQIIQEENIELNKQTEEPEELEESAKKRIEDCISNMKKTSTAKKISKFDEEYPDNIVEGSIVEFNKSFNANVELENHLEKINK